MKTRLCAYLAAGCMALPALAGYGKDDTQIMFAFGGGANNARLYAEVLAQAERDRPGKPVAGHADRVAGISAGAMLASFLTLPHHSDGRPRSAEETLEHMGKHAPHILGALVAGTLQRDKAAVQAGIHKHLAVALGSHAELPVSKLPWQTKLFLAEVVEEAAQPVSFSAADVILGDMPDTTLARALTAAVSVERLAGQVPLAGGEGESKATRTFMDAGSRGQHDPTPELIRSVEKSGKPAHIFAFEGGFGFAPETLEWAEGTRKAEELAAMLQMLARMIDKGEDVTEQVARIEKLADQDPKFGRVQVHLFHASQAAHRSCASCSNHDGKAKAECKAHAPNLARLMGRSIPAAAMLSMFDFSQDKLPIPILALNLQSGLATPEMNAELTRIAEAQMTGPKHARTESYAKLLEVLAEADGAKPGSGAASAAVESKDESKTESKAAKS